MPALKSGSQVGSYEVLASIGAGGMGEVYRARDSRLKRDVAIKVLPEGFSHDADRVARFQREAEVLASLNHPNIAHIYGLEETDGSRCLVLEFVDGETLQERIQRGPIPLDDAIDQSVPDSLDVHLILDKYGKNRRNKQRYREVRGAMSRTKRYVGNVEKTQTDSTRCSKQQ